MGWPGYWGLTAVIDSVCLFLFLSAFRFALRLYWDKTHRKTDERQRPRILIYGAGDEGNAACHALAFQKYWPFDVIGFIDDAPDKYGKTLNGKKVLGNRYHIAALARLYRVEEILIAEAEADLDKLTDIVKICQQSGLRYRVFSSLKDLDSTSRNPFPVRNVEFSDIFPLKRFHADQASVKAILADKTVMVNGAGGALGLELCRRILQLGCRRLIIVERYESYLNELVAPLLADFLTESIVPVLNGKGGEDTLEQVFENYRPSIVFHAAMRKYMPLLGVDLGDVGRINYFHTFNLAKAAAKFQCELFVMLSSLMAAKGGNFIADSLRIAEISLEYFFSDTRTELIIARLCDIAENRGGMVAIIEEQIRNRDTVVLPSPDTNACFISKHSAAEFILQTLVDAKRNEFDKRMFVCDAGSSVSLIEVAQKLANLYGLKRDRNLAFRFTSQSDEPAFISPQEISKSTSLYSLGIKAQNDNDEVTREAVKSVFKDFVALYSSNPGFQDWRARTMELLNLCGQISI